VFVFGSVEESEGGRGREESGSLSGGEVEEEEDLGCWWDFEGELGEDVVGERVGGAEGFELVESRDVVLGLRIVATWSKRR